MTKNTRSVLWSVMPIRGGRLAWLNFVLALFVGLGLSGCNKKTGLPILIDKEHIDARATNEEQWGAEFVD